MSTSVSWPTIGGTSYSIPAAGELNWQALSTFLVAIGNKAQSVDNTKLSIRTALTSPVTVASASDCVVITKLSVPAAVLVNLPAGILGQAFFIVDGTGDASSNNVTIDPNGAETINGSATYVINKDRAGVLIGFNGTSWTILAEYTNIAAGTIPRSSIALGSANQVVINSGTGALSSEAQLAKSRGGTGADNSSVTFPASGTLTTDAGSSTLTNKTIDDDNNVVQNVAVTALKTVIGQASTFLSFDGSGAPIATKAVPAGVVLGTTDAQVITLKDIDGGTASNTSRITVPKNTTTNINALTRKQGTILYDSTLDLLKYDTGATLVAVTPASTASPTAQGLVTSFFPTIASAVSTVSSASATITTSDGIQTLLMSTGNTNRTITLPAAASNTGRVLRVTKIDSGTGSVTATGALGTFIKLFLQYENMELSCDGTNWYVSAYTENTRSILVTLSYTSFGTTSGQSSTYRRSGNWMTIQSTFISGTLAGTAASFTLPTGFTLDTSPLVAFPILGQFMGPNTASTNFYTGGNSAVVFFDNSDTTALYFGLVGAGTSITKAGANSLGQTGSKFSLLVSFPVSEWA